MCWKKIQRGEKEMRRKEGVEGKSEQVIGGKRRKGRKGWKEGEIGEVWRVERGKGVKREWKVEENGEGRDGGLLEERRRGGKSWRVGGKDEEKGEEKTEERYGLR